MLSRYLIVSVLGQALLHSLLRSGSITIYSAPFWSSFFFRKSGEISFPPPNDQQCLLLFLENSNNNNHVTNKHVLVFCFVTCIGFWKVSYGKRRKYRSRGYQEQILDRELRDMFMLLKHNIFTPGPGQRTTFSFILFFRFIFFLYLFFILYQFSFPVAGFFQYRFSYRL